MASESATAAGDATRRQEDFLARLPVARGRYRVGERLSKLTWFKVGGPCDCLFTPADEDDLAAFLKSCPADIPVMVIGAGSNLLVRDGGLSGVVIRLGPAFSMVSVKENKIVAGAGARDVTLAKAALKEGLSGLEFLSGIPGSIGGALHMNAGAYGAEVKDKLLWAEGCDRRGNKRRFDLADLNYGYRHCGLEEEWIFIRACFMAEKGDRIAIERRMKEIQSTRGETQPVKSRTGGSTFKNPEGQKAWQLIDAAGCRGLRVGDAQVSEKHSNFLVNCDRASAEDIENLGEAVREKVFAKSGVSLSWEIKRIGKPAENGGAAPVAETLEGGEA